LPGGKSIQAVRHEIYHDLPFEAVGLHDVPDLEEL
jgi:hypothetical protein